MRHSKSSIARRLAYASGIVSLACSVVQAHDITTHVTWNREISRIVYARCAACHRPGSGAFSLLTYVEARPWANAIKDDVLQRRMPPWGAVKGFGSFRNDQTLTQEELGLFAAWVNGGAPEGNPNDLPTRPKIPPPLIVAHGAGEMTVNGDYRFQQPFALDGFVVLDRPKEQSAQITVEFPDGRIVPLVWLQDYRPRYDHPFLLRTPLSVPAGAVMRGLTAASGLVLLPLTSKK